MTTSFNPMVYLQHAWDGTNSVWGKAAIVLFYSYIWLNILWAIQVLIVPFLGFQCYYDAYTETEKTLVSSFLRQLNLVQIGFLLYADRGGIKVWNVAMVFVIFGGWALIYRSLVQSGLKHDYYPECQDLAISSLKMVWTVILWPAVALVCAFFDSRAGPGASEETEALV